MVLYCSFWSSLCSADEQPGDFLSAMKVRMFEYCVRTLSQLVVYLPKGGFTLQTQEAIRTSSKKMSWSLAMQFKGDDGRCSDILWPKPSK